MLRTNQAFLAYVAALYEQQHRKEDIVARTVAKGQRLLIQHEPAAKVMVIKEGIVKCFFAEDNAKEFILEFLGSGEIIGELEAIRDTPCLCNIEAMTEVTVYALSIPFFKGLLRTELQLNNMLLEIFAERMVNTSSRAAYQQLYTLEHSLSKLLELQQRQGLVLSKEDMAAYLGITIRSLNRALKGC